MLELNFFFYLQEHSESVTLVLIMTNKIKEVEKYRLFRSIAHL